MSAQTHTHTQALTAASYTALSQQRLHQHGTAALRHALHLLLLHHLVFRPLLQPPSAAVLLPHVCSYLSSEELLVGLARTAKLARDCLTPACFSSHQLTLDNDVSMRQVLTVLDLFPGCRALLLRYFRVDEPSELTDSQLQLCCTIPRRCPAKSWF